MKTSNEDIFKVNIPLISLDHKYHLIPNALPSVGQMSLWILAVPALPYNATLVDGVYNILVIYPFLEGARW
jgi:hypothetical protein